MEIKVTGTKMGYRFTIILPIITIMMAFTPEQTENKSLNLEDFKLDFNIEKFYTPFLEKAKLYSEQRDAILNGKSEKDFGDKLVDPWSVETISIDAVLLNEKFESSKQLVGMQYNMKSWTEGSNLAYYGDTHFDAVHMMRSKEGNFMALVATNESENEESFKRLLYQIEKKYGKAIVQEEEFFGGYYVYSWQLKDRVLAISSKYNDKSNELKVGIDTDRKTIDMANPATIDTKFFLVNNKYRNVISGNLKSGPWLYFDKVLEK